MYNSSLRTYHCEGEKLSSADPMIFKSFNINKCVCVFYFLLMGPFTRPCSGKDMKKSRRQVLNLVVNWRPAFQSFCSFCIDFIKKIEFQEMIHSHFPNHSERTCSSYLEMCPSMHINKLKYSSS